MRPAPLLLIAAASLLLLGARARPIRPHVPTFSGEVVRIFQQNCQSCHREGDVAPFSLITYEDARANAQRIKYMTSTKQMPPWKPDASCATFRGERRLSESDIATLAAWVNAGAPEGNRADLPPQKEFSSEWTLGTPDIELKMPESFTAPVGADTYRCFTLPSGVGAETAIAAFDTRPGNSEIVHHVLAFIDATGQSVALDEAEAGPGYTCFGGPGFTPDGALGGWAPGYRAEFLQDGIATKLPVASRIVLQVHYHPHDEHVEPDQTSIALYRARTPVKKWLRVLPLINNTFVIPAGAPAHKVNAMFQVPFPVHLWEIAPHMHLLGKSMKVEAFRPDGSSECLVNIPDWNFNWQNAYFYRQPISIPAGTLLTLEATYDNSSDNPLQPNNPPKEVRWGEATTDEMCLAFIGFTVDAENVGG
jgi:hypothetical protein